MSLKLSVEKAYWMLKEENPELTKKEFYEITGLTPEKAHKFRNQLPNKSLFNSLLKISELTKKPINDFIYEK